MRGVLEPDAQREFDLRPERSPHSLLGYTPWPSSQEILRTGPDVQAVAISPLTALWQSASARVRLLGGKHPNPPL